MIRVLLADDERLFRDAMSDVLNMVEGIEVVGRAADGEEALSLIREVRPDVAVIDLQMPKLDGIGVVAALAEEGLAVATLIVTSHALPGVLDAAMDVGATGLVPKDTSTVELIDIIRKAASGLRHVDPYLAVESKMIGPNPLSPREVELLRLAAKGGSVESIAKEAKISWATARNHFSNCRSKLGASSRHEAVFIAKSRGWI